MKKGRSEGRFTSFCANFRESGELRREATGDGQLTSHPHSCLSSPPSAILLFHFINKSRNFFQFLPPLQPQFPSLEGVSSSILRFGMGERKDILLWGGGLGLEGLIGAQCGRGCGRDLGGFRPLPGCRTVVGHPRAPYVPVFLLKLLLGALCVLYRVFYVGGLNNVRFLKRGEVTGKLDYAA